MMKSAALALLGGALFVHTLPAQDTTRADTVRNQPIVMEGLTVIGTVADLDATTASLRRVPGAVALIGRAELARTRQSNLPDVLRMTPGVFAQPRQGAADESQLSIRGSGLRNNFHLRGVNVLINGMPYRNADGFTDFESLELLTALNVQVYKGGNALRYGGSTLGGAVNIETRTGYDAPAVAAYAQGGSYGLMKAQAATGGARGRFDWYASYARTTLDGYREWSDQQRDRLNLHGGVILGDRTDLRAFYVFADVSERLPGALTAAEARANPRQAAPGHVQDRWGRDYALHHLGVQLRTQLSPSQRIEIAPYFQYRDIDHPIFQVISQVSRDAGVEARYENGRFTLGGQLARGAVDHRRYVNDGGGHGALTKDQREAAGTAALYAENVFSVVGPLSSVIAFRVDHATRDVTDNFQGDGDQSDRRSYTAFMPKIGVLYDLAPRGARQLYANASRSWEPPLLLELNSVTVPGFVNVAPQDAWQFEVGARGRTPRLSWDVSLFDIELSDEITNVNVQPFPNAPFTVPSYRNIERSRHYGLELGLGVELLRGLLAHEMGSRDALRLDLAYTFARYRFLRDSLHAGNEIPGAPRHFAAAELRYEHPAGFSLSPRLDWVPQAYPVDGANTVSNGSWHTWGLRAEWQLAQGRSRLFVEARNLADARYSGTVQASDGAGRFFEPADRRSIYGGIQWGM